jgi:O-acetyl-ADP-ribose deacetylase (regulator of RNase III)
MLKLISEQTDLQDGSEIEVPEQFALQIRHLDDPENGGYFVPVFTSQQELDKGESSSSINQTLGDLIEMSASWEKCLGFVINPWDKKLIIPKEMLDFLKQYKPQSHIEYLRGSVVDMHVDAIVNAANSSLLGGGGVDGAIHKAAGPELLEACRSLGGCKTGEAKITPAFGISYADYIIHTVGPVYSGKSEDADALSACYINSMELALKNGCKSVAFPCISTGVYGYPLDQAANIALLSVAQWLMAHPDNVMNVYLCCYKEEEFTAFKDLTDTMKQQSAEEPTEQA